MLLLQWIDPPLHSQAGKHQRKLNRPSNILIGNATTAIDAWPGQHHRFTPGGETTHHLHAALR